jgi:Fur family ferric uptake transcriptional regulator
METQNPQTAKTVVRELEQDLIRDGFRLTRARHVVLTALASFDQPFTASELEQVVSECDASVGRASVFRTLALMEERGVVEKLHQAGSEHYTLCLCAEHHHHVTCVECGRTEDFAVDEEHDLLAGVNDVVKRLGYQPRSHVLAVYGVCASCQELADPSEPKIGRSVADRPPLGGRNRR